MEKELILTIDSFNIYQNEKILIKGDMASGKTQLLQRIAQQLPKYQFDFLSQTLNDNFIYGTVGENLAFNLENNAVPRNNMLASIQTTADLYELSDLLDAHITDLSTHQKQVLALAQILIRPTPILLLDEPYMIPTEYTGTLIITGNFEPELFDQVIDLSKNLSESDYRDTKYDYSRWINQDKAILSVTELAKTISFSVFEGEKVMVNAPLDIRIADMIAGFYETIGEVDYYYEDITHQSLDKRGRKIGYIMANPQDMIFVDKISQVDISDDILALCGLSEFQHDKLSTLSFRQQKLFTTACILMQDTPIVIFDQPEITYFSAILNYLDQKGVTVILTSASKLFLPLVDREVHL